MTLSFVLNGIYTVASIATGLYIEYFEVVYLVIGYIYVIAAVFMIKYDLIKQHEELQKVLEVKCLNQKGTDPQGFELVPFSIPNIFCIFR